MKWAFWVCAGLVAYTFLGYPLWLYLRSRWRPYRIERAPIFPEVSIVMAVRNEAGVLPLKLRNLLEMDYPPLRYEVVVVSDGSTDGTNEILRAAASERLRVIVFPEHAGKARALNRAIQAARGEIIVFTDARQPIDSDAVRRLAADFADPRVGCVSGELVLGKPGAPEASPGLGCYWRYEKMIRQWESASGSVVGATGALYAARRKLLPELPDETLLDDVYIPLEVARRGKSVVFEPGARAWDLLGPSGREFRRKVRTLTGNYQILHLAPWLLSGANPLRFEFICHKLLRLLVPFEMIGLLVSSLSLGGLFYGTLAGLQIVFYGLALLGFLHPRLGIISRLGEIALAILLLNAAAALALFYYLSGKREVWAR